MNKDLGVTLVIVSHELRSVRKICHRIAVLDQGRIIEQGTSLQLFSKPEHPTTRELLTAVHGEADISLFQETGRSLLFLRLHFTGTGTKQPLLSTLISSLQVEVNIVCGWIDVVENTPIGSLTVALCATRRQDVVDFCTKHQVHCEFL
ncbi:MAG: hypothetical protein FJZ58_01010 [Chlamydiae bacterium]|nr:hypothetical protein [Chlamydiota bacterium]